MAMMDKLTSIGGLIKLGNVIEAVGNNMKTDMSKSQVKGFIKTYATIQKEDIEFIALAGEWRSPYIRVSDKDMDDAKQRLQARLRGDPIVDAGTP